MAYPNHVTLEFCHRRRVWRAFGEAGRKPRHGHTIVAFDQDLDRLKEICPNHTRISPKDTGAQNACMCRVC